MIDIHALIHQSLFEDLGGTLFGIHRQYYATYLDPSVLEGIYQPHDLQIISYAEVPADLVLLDIIGVDANDRLCLILQLHQHRDLTVRMESRQHSGCMIVIEQLAAEF